MTDPTTPRPRARPRCRYYTATTLDGFLADDHDRLDWLFEQDQGERGEAAYEAFVAGVGALVMGATTYAWVVDHLAASGEPWPYEQPCFVLTHRDLEPASDSVRLVQGPVEQVWPDVARAAGEEDVWVVGGGGVAADLAAAGLLDDVLLSIAPVTLGSGRPLFPRPFDLRLVELEHVGSFAVARYEVVGPRPAQPTEA